MISQRIDRIELESRPCQWRKVATAGLTFIAWAGYLYVSAWLLWFIVDMVGAR